MASPCDERTKRRGKYGIPWLVVVAPIKSGVKTFAAGASNLSSVEGYDRIDGLKGALQIEIASVAMEGTDRRCARPWGSDARARGYPGRSERVRGPRY